MIVRWLAGDQVETFYERLQAHFDAALEGFKEDEHQARNGSRTPRRWNISRHWMPGIENGRQISSRSDPQANVFVLSTLSADEMNIAYLPTTSWASLPPRSSAHLGAADEPTDRGSGVVLQAVLASGDGRRGERMCFFAFLQKSDESGDDTW